VVAGPQVPGPAGSNRQYENTANGRRLSIGVLHVADSTGTTVLPGEKVVDLGDGRQATLYYSHEATVSDSGQITQGAPQTQLYAFQGDVEIIVTGTGLSDDELVAIARTTTAVDGGSGFHAPDVPSDLVAGPLQDARITPDDLFAGGFTQSDITYQLPDEVRAGITVYSNNGGTEFQDRLTKAKTAPTAELFTIQAQGTTAVVHRTVRPGADDVLVDVSWVEPGGHLVTINANSSHSSATTDATSLAARARTLSDAEFQSIIDQHGR
jgi:hypothetical protein